MLFIVGFVVVLGSVVGGYVMHHGNLAVLWQPNEFIIICGAALGQFLIANPIKVVKDAGKSMKFLMKGSPYKKADYTELLLLLYVTFKTMKTKGMLEMESHIENPHESSLFSSYPKFLHNHHAVAFLCDNIRVMTMGVEDHYQIEELMERDLESHHHEHERISTAIVNTGDAMPALGIVAAVLGVITTMGSITEPPAVLGSLIGAALVGTFSGILISYGFLSPMGKFIGAYYEDDVKYLQCIKVALLAHLHGNAPVVSIEFARASIDSHERPTFQEIDEAVNNIGSAAPAAG
ncbi:MAG TPA: flagellar motor stator protein MotA [Rickettsiales bacterium]|nr:flagellar motor stator protein MotA [Rickettsiales bacterium]